MLFTLLAMILPARTDAQETAGAILTRVDGNELEIMAEVLGKDGGLCISGDFTADGKGRYVSLKWTDDYQLFVKVYDESFNIDSSMHLYQTIVQKFGYRDEYDYGFVDLKVRYFAKPGYATESWVTQTLFNSDEHYEVVIPIYDDYFTDPNGANRKYANGFSIINDLGQIVCQGKFKSKYWRIDSAVVLIVGEKKYLYFDDGHDIADCFLIEPEKSSLRRVELPKGLKAMPNVARASENVNLTFPEVAETRTVSLVNTSGRLVRTDRIAAGIGSYSLNTGNLAPGLYVVTLSDGTTSIETAKIIIR